MNRMNFRGGADYDISGVLGQKFKDLVNILRSGSIDRFLYKNSINKDLPNTASEIDIHYALPEALIATATAFRQVEAPDLGKRVVGNKIYEELMNIYDELYDDKNRDPFSPAPVPVKIKVDNSMVSTLPIDWLLVRGGELLLLDNYGYDDDQTPLRAIIMYLAKVLSIANLDTSSSQIYSDIIKDPNFKNLVDSLKQTIRSTVSFDAGKADELDDGLKKGIINIINAIKNVYKNPSPTKNNINVPEFINNNKNNDRKTSLQTVGIDVTPEFETFLNNTIPAFGSGVSSTKGMLGSPSSGTGLTTQADDAINSVHNLYKNNIGRQLVLLNILSTRINKPAATDTEYNYELKKLKDNFQKFTSRYQLIPSAIDNPEIRNNFLRGFTTGVQPKFASSPTGLAPGSSAPPKGSNMSAEVLKLYNDEIVKDSKFYDEFFNIVDIAAGNNVPLGDPAILVNPAGYRLNVKKAIGYSALTGGQRGGAFGDIYFVTLIPAYLTDGSVGDIWLNRNVVVRKSDINSGKIVGIPADALRDIFSDVYNLPVGTNNAVILGVNVDLNTIYNSVLARQSFGIDYKSYLRDAVDKALKSPIPFNFDQWSQGEYKLATFINKYNSQWVREGDEFKRYDKDHKVIDQQPADACALIKNNTSECLQTLEQCINSPDTSDICKNFMDLQFSVNAPLTAIRDEIEKMDPKIALSILNRLKFGSSMSDANDTYHGIRYMKVQTVGSWVEELMKDEDRCNIAPAGTVPSCGTLKQQLGPLAPTIIQMIGDKSKHPFFNYLDVLVQWVNSNPQVLNEELSKDVHRDARYPEPNDKYRSYDYASPYKMTQLRARNDCYEQELQRLKNSILNGLEGSNGSAIISDIASLPLNLQQPLNRAAFVNTLPIASGFFRMGGGYAADMSSDFSGLLKDLNNSDGYSMFSDIYADLKKGMESISSNRKFKLASNSDANIMAKLDALKIAEEDLRKAMVSLAEKSKLYQQSHGYINAYDMSDDKLKDLLKKHSYLYQLSGTYNKKAVNIIDHFLAIVKATSDKMEKEMEHGKSKYSRPLNKYF